MPDKREVSVVLQFGDHASCAQVFDQLKSQGVECDVQRFAQKECAIRLGVVGIRGTRSRYPDDGNIVNDGGILVNASRVVSKPTSVQTTVAGRSATVTKDGVTVGCTQASYDEVKQVYDAMVRLRG